MSITLDYCKLRGITFLYCGLPVVLFCTLWLRPLVGLAVAGAFIAAFTLVHRHDQRNVSSPLGLMYDVRKIGARGVQDGPIEAGSITLSVHVLMLIVMTGLLWCMLGGQGGMWYQSGDWDSRNALFRDLITHRWPVRYSVDGGWMSYYIAHWLPAAAVGKLAALAGLGGAVWAVGNLALLVWTAFGITLVLLHVVVAARASGKAQIIVCVAITVLFATPDLIGIVLTGGYPRGLEKMHLEWWAANMQFSSLTTCLFWVFNQAVIPWLCTLCFLSERTFGGYLPIWACCLFAGPFPAVGLAQLMLGYGVYTLVKSRDRQKTVRDAISLPNALALPALAVLFLYFSSNGASAADANGAWTKATLLQPPLYFPSQPDMIVRALVFVLVEVLLIPVLLWLCKVRGPLLPLVTTVLLLCPWVRTSAAADYCMRVSIPAIMCLSVLCSMVLSRALGASERGHAAVPAIVALSLVLAVGAVTPAFEFYRGFRSVARVGVAESVNDPFGSFENKDLFDAKNGWPRTNYVTQPSQGDSFFFRYLAQR